MAEAHKDFNFEDILENAASSIPQAIGGLGIQMLPVALQKPASFAITAASYAILKEVFPVIASQGMNFNTMSLTLKQIQKQLEEIERKVDKLLRGDLETAKDRLQHAFAHLELAETYQTAYEEFKEVLNLASKHFARWMTCKIKFYANALQYFLV